VTPKITFSSFVLTLEPTWKKPVGLSTSDVVDVGLGTYEVSFPDVGTICCTFVPKAMVLVTFAAVDPGKFPFASAVRVDTEVVLETQG
jgi:hypothetical protein